MKRNILFITVVFFLSLFAGSTQTYAQDKVLRILNWTEYIAKDTITNFEKRFGCKVEYTEYEVPEVMLSKVHFTPNYYDIVIAYDFIVANLISDKKVLKLDLAKIPNNRNIDPKYRTTEKNPEMLYAAPYLMGTTGLVYREDLYPGEVISWKDLFEPKEALKGKIILLKDRREVIGAALKYHGCSMNSENEKEIQKAVKTVRKIKPYLYEITSSMDVARTGLLKGDAVMALAYSGDALSWIAESGSKLKYIIPREGGHFFMDVMAILSDAPNRETAYKFINYILEPEVGASLTNAIHYASPNRAAQNHISKEILNDPLILLPDGVRKKMENILSVESEKEYNSGWRKIIK